MRFFAALIALVMIAGATNAQQQVPNIKGPPGTKTTVTSMTKTFNFYPLKRTVRLPWDRLQMPYNEVPEGNQITSVFKSPSSKAQRFYDNPSKYVPSFGSPKRRAYQTFSGKDGNGIILYMEYDKKTPENAVEILSKYFFNASEPPHPNKSTEMEQFLVNEHTVIIWAFAERKSMVKQTHQEMIFDLISEVARAQK